MTHEEEQFDNDFSDNSCTNIDSILEHISLTTDSLNIRGNEIKKIDCNKLPKNITNIVASKNMMETIIFDDRNWEEINLKDNYLAIDEIRNLNVKKLNLSDSFDGSIRRIGKLILDNNCFNEVLFEDTYVLHLTMEDNCMRELMSIPKGIERAYFGKNELRKICVKFEDQLRVLDLENNELDELNFYLPITLERLNMSHNKIAEIELVLFSDLVILLIT